MGGKRNKTEHTFPTHQCSIPRPFSTFPESTTCLTDQGSTAHWTVFWAVDLFARAEATGATVLVQALGWMLQRVSLTRSCGWRVRWDGLLLRRGICCQLVLLSLGIYVQEIALDLLIAWVDYTATAESAYCKPSHIQMYAIQHPPEPTITFAIVCAATSFWQFLTGDNTERVLWL